jgi:UDP-glucose 4-epimerase
VVPNWLRQAVKGGSIVVHGDGSQTRDFVYISDVTRALIAASTAPDLSGDVINVGSGVETSMQSLAEMILKSTGSKAEILATPKNNPGVSRMCADLTLAKKKLNFSPKTSLEAGLRKTLEQDSRFTANK